MADYARREDVDKLHDKVDLAREDIAEIKGMIKQKKNDWSVVGILSAIALGVWNLIK